MTAVACATGLNCVLCLARGRTAPATCGPHALYCAGCWQAATAKAADLRPFTVPDPVTAHAQRLLLDGERGRAIALFQNLAASSAPPADAVVH